MVGQTDGRTDGEEVTMTMTPADADDVTDGSPRVRHVAAARVAGSTGLRLRDTILCRN